MKDLVAVCSNSYENTTLKITHSQTSGVVDPYEICIFIESRLIFTIFLCLFLEGGGGGGGGGGRGLREGASEDMKFPGILKNSNGISGAN